MQHLDVTKATFLARSAGLLASSAHRMRFAANV
eukprot:CAMPEP_0206495736 /NCGR_PEP_ID=MMETSP0324_2-20121206/48817_1 /ASSEMBLY_ACC=CAM_ASM_000836 /TAXON_ID=2866 /ORGANISM="Crypthecodinium cohnii, Strain Seligo" /LENGTH=32 /DNA_ID= /DNA_START= /DNA_END= /DNA_ORIENTATION=